MACLDSEAWIRPITASAGLPGISRGMKKFTVIATIAVTT